MSEHQIILVESLAEAQMAKAMFRAYAASLDFSLEYQGFEAELAAMPGRYGAPSGCILLAMGTDAPVGCVALREIEKGEKMGRFDGALGRVCEMKRLFVRVEARGRGIGRAMCEGLILRARAMGYRRMKLDTSGDMLAAQGLYRGLGFVPCERYNDDPDPGTLYFELALGGRGERGG